ncbi:hypothetical protein N431DRAFT_552003 [Stipitochalara longipes BDJ]|nr:hypothetical protein N431DRAFT_552003 [Stipitochalara longipes BDJ]
MPRLREPQPKLQPPPKPLQKHTSSLELSPAKPRSTDFLSTLPSELLHQIISFAKDRVTSACLGLASYRLYLHHFSVHGKVGWDEVTIYTVEMKENNYWRPGGSATYNVLGPMTMVVLHTLETMLSVGLGGRVWNEKARAWIWTKGEEDRLEGIKGIEEADESMAEKTESEESSDGCETETPDTSDWESDTDQIEEETSYNKRNGDEIETTEPKRIKLDGSARPLTVPVRQCKTTMAGVPEAESEAPEVDVDFNREACNS